MKISPTSVNVFICAVIGKVITDTLLNNTHAIEVEVRPVLADHAEVNFILTIPCAIEIADGQSTDKHAQEVVDEVDLRQEAISDVTTAPR